MTQHPEISELKVWRMLPFRGVIIKSNRLSLPYPPQSAGLGLDIAERYFIASLAYLLFFAPFPYSLVSGLDNARLHLILSLAYHHFLALFAAISKVGFEYFHTPSCFIASLSSFSLPRFPSLQGWVWIFQDFYQRSSYRQPTVILSPFPILPRVGFGISRLPHILSTFAPFPSLQCWIWIF